jgi:DeoR family transcriptional regulator, aga operon transcriptional repressor
LQTALLPAQRRQHIGELIGAGHIVRVDDLSHSLRVSPVTIRRDLEHLQSMGLLERTHGGAMRTRAFGPEPPYTDKRLRCASEKRRIAAVAAGLVRNGQTILLNGGTTTLAVAHAIAQRADLAEVHLVTVNVPIVLEVEREDLDIVLLGGQYRPQANSLVGTLTLAGLRHFAADLAVLGLDGIDARFGATYPHSLEAGVAEAMLDRCHGDVVLLADHRKLGVAAGNVGIPLERVTKLITDAQADDRLVQEFRRRGVEVLLA